MPVILVQSHERYAVEETVFHFKRLRYRQQEELQYLYTIRGALDEVAYNQLCIAAALTGWDELYGINGLIAWPPCDEPPGMGLAGLTDSRKAQLEAIYAVVAELPRDISIALAQRVNAAGPDELKKSALPILSAGMPSPMPLPESNLAADNAAAIMPMMGSALPVTGED